MECQTNLTAIDPYKINLHAFLNTKLKKLLGVTDNTEPTTSQHSVSERNDNVQS